MAKTNHKGACKYYRQITARGKYLFKCGVPGCTSSIYEEIMPGRICTCWRCGNEFVVTRANLKTKYFHCIDCTKPRPEGIKEVPANIDQLIEEFWKKGEE